MTEEWRPVPEFEDRYMVSNLGQVKSLPRIVHHGFEHRATKYLAGGPLKRAYRMQKGKRQTPHVNLHKIDPNYVNNCKAWRVAVAVLVYRAFVGPVAPGHVVRLKDGDVDNVQLSNLMMISRKENYLLNGRG